MRISIFFVLVMLFLPACGGRSNNEGALPTLMPIPNLNESPRIEATPDPGLPPTWTPVPDEPQGHLLDVNGNGGASGETLVFEGTRFLHTVQRGETLGIIAARYGVAVADLVTLNNIDDPNVIEVGQQIIIPVSGE